MADPNQGPDLGVTGSASAPDFVSSDLNAAWWQKLTTGGAVASVCKSTGANVMRGLNAALQRSGAGAVVDQPLVGITANTLRSLTLYDQAQGGNASGPVGTAVARALAWLSRGEAAPDLSDDDRLTITTFAVWVAFYSPAASVQDAALSRAQVRVRADAIPLPVTLGNPGEGPDDDAGSAVYMPGCFPVDSAGNALGDTGAGAGPGTPRRAPLGAAESAGSRLWFAAPPAGAAVVEAILKRRL